MKLSYINKNGTPLSFHNLTMGRHGEEIKATIKSAVEKNLSGKYIIRILRSQYDLLVREMSVKEENENIIKIACTDPFENVEYIVIRK